MMAADSDSDDAAAGEPGRARAGRREEEGRRETKEEKAVRY